MRRWLFTAGLALGLTGSLTAFAQDNPNCPPGAWFCEETEVPPPAEATPDDDAAAPSADAAQAAPQRGSTTVVLPPSGSGRPPIVVYQQVPSAPPAQVVIVAPPPEPVEPEARPVRDPQPPVAVGKKRARHRAWGFNMRLEGVAMGRRQGAAEDAGMGGLGMSLRFRPVPAFALDAGLDLLGGTDYNGFRRTEVPFSLSGLLYLNPRSAVQFYLTGGVDWSHATVESDTYADLLSAGDGFRTEYDYFGGHGGAGLEFRVTHLVSLNVDGVGFVRSRTDGGTVPEFVDPQTGRSTNTSGGGLFRAGLTFWW